MTLATLLLLVNLVILWWLFLSASNTFMKVLLCLLAVLNSWLALEHFRVVPSRIGQLTLFRGQRPARN